MAHYHFSRPYGDNCFFPDSPFKQSCRASMSSRYDLHLGGCYGGSLFNHCRGTHRPVHNCGGFWGGLASGLTMGLTNLFGGFGMFGSGFNMFSGGMNMVQMPTFTTTSSTTKKNSNEVKSGNNGNDGDNETISTPSLENNNQVEEPKKPETPPTPVIQNPPVKVEPIKPENKVTKPENAQAAKNLSQEEALNILENIKEYSDLKNGDEWKFKPDPIYLTLCSKAGVNVHVLTNNGDVEDKYIKGQIYVILTDDGKIDKYYVNNKTDSNGLFGYQYEFTPVENDLNRCIITNLSKGSSDKDGYVKKGLMNTENTYDETTGTLICNRDALVSKISGSDREQIGVESIIPEGEQE